MDSRGLDSIFIAAWQSQKILTPPRRILKREHTDCNILTTKWSPPNSARYGDSSSLADVVSIVCT